MSIFSPFIFPIRKSLTWLKNLSNAMLNYIKNLESSSHEDTHIFYALLLVHKMKRLNLFFLLTVSAKM
jgi:hypothetical protein